MKLALSADKLPFQKKEKEVYMPKTGVLGNADDYSVRIFTQQEKILYFLLGMIVVGAVLYIFYESLIVSLIAGAVGGYYFLPLMNKSLINKRKNKLLLQFKDLLDALSTSLGAGRNVFDAFAFAETDLKIEYPADSDIIKEVHIILHGITNNITIEELLVDFGDRSGLKEIKDFASVFETCYRKGANIQEIIQNTAEVITDEIEISMEIQTMVSGQKTEQNVMTLMPIVFVFIMKNMGGNLIDLSSVIGIISMTAAIVMFIIAYFVGKKILDIKL